MWFKCGVEVGFLPAVSELCGDGLSLHSRVWKDSGEDGFSTGLFRDLVDTHRCFQNFCTDQSRDRSFTEASWDILKLSWTFSECCGSMVSLGDKRL